jgi:hypothetical protein
MMEDGEDDVTSIGNPEERGRKILKLASEL